jgi:hypothetical protein
MLEIQNILLNSTIVVNTYMPIHEEDLPLILKKKGSIYNAMNTYQSHTIIVLVDFKRNLKLTERRNVQIYKI